MISQSTQLGTAYNADCFDVMRSLPDGSVDMILADLPYGTTACKWDTVIPFEPMWKEFHRIAKPNAAIVLTASQPFTSALVMSNVKSFKYQWVWDKSFGANFANAKKMPLKTHEDVCVFCFGKTPYHPQKVEGAKNHVRNVRAPAKRDFMAGACKQIESDVSGLKYPKSIQTFPKHASQCGLHPTQKPVTLFEYLIKTYTNEKDLVFDPTAGSLTTGVASENLNRRWICSEQDAGYFEKGCARFENIEFDI